MKGKKLAMPVSHNSWASRLRDGWEIPTFKVSKTQKIIFNCVHQLKKPQWNSVLEKKDPIQDAQDGSSSSFISQAQIHFWWCSFNEGKNSQTGPAVKPVFQLHRDRKALEAENFKPFLGESSPKVPENLQARKAGNMLKFCTSLECFLLG